jgi:hypothetical protein
MACLLVLGSVTVASATSSRDNRSSGKDDRKVVVFDLLGRQVNSTEIDHAPTDLVPDDFSQGDQLVLAVDLFQAGTKVGEESSICMVTRVEAHGASTVHCTGVHSLPGGQVTTRSTTGQMSSQRRIVLPRHQGRHGQVQDRSRRYPDSGADHHGVASHSADHPLRIEQPGWRPSSGAPPHPLSERQGGRRVHTTGYSAARRLRGLPPA